MKNDIKGSVRILSFLKNDIKVFSAIYGDNWQSLNIFTTGETFAQNIIVYINEVATSDVHELSIKTAIMHQNNFYMVGNIHRLFLFYLL